MVGENTIGNIWTDARKKFGFVKKKVSNHTVRKTGIGRLLDSGVPDTFVAQHEEMKSTDSLKSYISPGEEHMVQISHAIDRFNAPLKLSAPLPSAYSSSTVTRPPTDQGDVDLNSGQSLNPKRSNILQVNNVSNAPPSSLGGVFFRQVHSTMQRSVRSTFAWERQG